jgi:hypothetical protein
MCTASNKIAALEGDAIHRPVARVGVAPIYTYTYSNTIANGYSCNQENCIDRIKKTYSELRNKPYTMNPDNIETRLFINNEVSLQLVIIPFYKILQLTQFSLSQAKQGRPSRCTMP